MKKMLLVLLMLVPTLANAADCQISRVTLTTEWRPSQNGFNYAFFVVPHAFGVDGNELSPTSCPDSRHIFGTWYPPDASSVDDGTCMTAQVPKQLKRTLNRRRNRYIAAPMWDCDWADSIDISPNGELFMNPPAPGTWTFEFVRTQSDTDDTLFDAEVTVTFNY